MSFFSENKNFYPTPSNLISKMLSKIKNHPKKILEPSAGKGDIIDKIRGSFCNYLKYSDISAIEKDETLCATLLGKKIKVIDTDFLTYSGPDKFDLIIANPPFDNGDKHLLKAIDIMYRGQIIFIINAESIRNPYSNTKKDLVRKLNELGAEIEFLENQFSDAERTTSVEIALISIIIDRKVEDDLFADVDDKIKNQTIEIEEKNELSTGRTIEDLVNEFNQVVEIGTKTIIDYFRNYKKIGKYLVLNQNKDKAHLASGDMTTIMQDLLNKMLVDIRTDFWRRIISLEAVRSRLTQKKQAEFEHGLSERCNMDFTVNNVRSFILNIINGYEKTLTDAVLEIFDKFTISHCYTGGLHEKNIHYFNGWKTNQAFKVGKKVIIPIRGGYNGPFISWGKWSLDWQAARVLDDIDLVMNYFDGRSEYKSISTALNESFKQGISSGVESTYFRITAHKKGTIHLTFINDDILRRFNVVACKGKNWLPETYGKKAYKNMDQPEKEIIDSFEGEKSYNKHVSRPLFAEKRDNIQIAA